MSWLRVVKTECFIQVHNFLPPNIGSDFVLFCLKKSAVIDVDCFSPREAQKSNCIFLQRNKYFLAMSRRLSNNSQKFSRNSGPRCSSSHGELRDTKTSAHTASGMKTQGSCPPCPQSLGLCQASLPAPKKCSPKTTGLKLIPPYLQYPGQLNPSPRSRDLLFISRSPFWFLACVSLILCV